MAFSIKPCFFSCCFTVMLGETVLLDNVVMSVVMLGVFIVVLSIDILSDCTFRAFS